VSDGRPFAECGGKLDLWVEQHWSGSGGGRGEEAVGAQFGCHVLRAWTSASCSVLFGRVQWSLEVSSQSTVRTCMPCARIWGCRGQGTVDDCLLVAPENMDGGGCSGVEMMAGWQAVGVVHLLLGVVERSVCDCDA
jgi:hypothetical protein